MDNVKLNPSLIDSDGSFNPIKYFISKHSFYPNIVELKCKRNISQLFERLKDKFNEFQYFSKSFYVDNNIDVRTFLMIFTEGDSSIIFKYDGYSFYYYTNEIDEGLLNILSTIIEYTDER